MNNPIGVWSKPGSGRNIWQIGFSLVLELLAKQWLVCAMSKIISFSLLFHILLLTFCRFHSCLLNNRVLSRFEFQVEKSIWIEEFLSTEVLPILTLPSIKCFGMNYYSKQNVIYEITSDLPKHVENVLKLPKVEGFSRV